MIIWQLQSDQYLTDDCHCTTRKEAEELFAKDITYDSLWKPEIDHGYSAKDTVCAILNGEGYIHTSELIKERQ